MPILSFHYSPKWTSIWRLNGHLFRLQMDIHLDSKWMIKFQMVVYPLYHVGRVVGGMVVTTMT